MTVYGAMFVSQPEPEWFGKPVPSWLSSWLTGVVCPGFSKPNQRLRTRFRMKGPVS
jgi:hypothetical protein